MRLIEGRSFYKEPWYNSYRCMRSRCYRPKDPSYKYYGGRGIAVCDEWHRFDVFKKWALSNGYSDALTIDRINNDGEYSPSNCRWATPSQQANNRRTNRFVTYNGDTKTVAQWAEYFGVDKNRFSSAIRRGNTIDEILDRETKNGNISA